MSRSQMLIRIPEVWQLNKEKGLCPVCAKEKKDFEPLRRQYCSQNCADKYSDCFMSWSRMREIIFKRDGLKCKICNIEYTKKWLDIDHIIPLISGGKMWDINNLQVLCKECHKKKTRTDLKKSKSLEAFHE